MVRIRTEENTDSLAATPPPRTLASLYPGQLEATALRAPRRYERNVTRRQLNILNKLPGQTTFTTNGEQRIVEAMALE